MMRLLFLFVGVAFSGCMATRPVPLTTESRMVLLVRATPEAATDAIARAFGAVAVIDTSGTVVLRYAHGGRSHVTTLTVEPSVDGATRIDIGTVADGSDGIRDLERSTEEFRRVGLVYALVPPDTPPGCTPEIHWSDAQADDAGVPLDATESAPVLIGGMTGLSARLQYPDEARRAGRQGRVWISFIVASDGTVECVAPIRASAPSLTQEAIRVVRTTRFEPGRRNGSPIRVRYTLPVQFSLR